ncbi:cytidine deaminase, partial [Micromonospora zhanjiangensis]
MPESPVPPAGAPAGSTAPAELSAEDAKLVTLARGARSRVGAVEGAAVRD